MMAYGMTAASITKRTVDAYTVDASMRMFLSCHAWIKAATHITQTVVVWKLLHLSVKSVIQTLVEPCDLRTYTHIHTHRAKLNPCRRLPSEVQIALSRLLYADTRGVTSTCVSRPLTSLMLVFILVRIRLMSEEFTVPFCMHTRAHTHTLTRICAHTAALKTSTPGEVTCLA